MEMRVGPPNLVEPSRACLCQRAQQPKPDCQVSGRRGEVSSRTHHRRAKQLVMVITQRRMLVTSTGLPPNDRLQSS